MLVTHINKPQHKMFLISWFQNRVDFEMVSIQVVIDQTLMFSALAGRPQKFWG